MTPPLCNNNLAGPETVTMSNTPLSSYDTHSDVCDETPLTSSVSIASSNHQPQSVASLHVSATREPDTSNTDVSELVVKAKKAAASLWMILHAQVSL